MNITKNERSDVLARKEKVNDILKELESAQIEMKSLRKLSDYIAKRLVDQGDTCNGSTFRRNGSPYKRLLLKFMGQEESIKTESHKHLARLQEEAFSYEMSMLKLKQRCSQLESQNENLNIKLNEERTQKRALSAPPKAEVYSSSRLKRLEDELDRTREIIIKLMELAEGFSISFSQGFVKDKSASETHIFMHKNDFPYFFSKKQDDIEFD